MKKTILIIFVIIGLFFLLNKIRKDRLTPPFYKDLYELAASNKLKNDTGYFQYQLKIADWDSIYLLYGVPDEEYMARLFPQFSKKYDKFYWNITDFLWEFYDTDELVILCKGKEVKFRIIHGYKRYSFFILNKESHNAEYFIVRPINSYNVFYNKKEKYFTIQSQE